MADALDSKSGVSDGVRVRVPPPVLLDFLGTYEPKRKFMSAFLLLVYFVSLQNTDEKFLFTEDTSV